MIRPIRALAILSALFLTFFSTHSFAQTASCTGVAEWNASTIYNAGQRLVYKNTLYETLVQIWNTAPDYCPSCNWYKSIGSCDGSGGGGNGGGTPPVVAITAPTSGTAFACAT